MIKMMMANQVGIAVVDKKRKKVIVTDVALTSHSNMRKKEDEKSEKYQEPREELEKMWNRQQWSPW